MLLTRLFVVTDRLGAELIAVLPDGPDTHHEVAGEELHITRSAPGGWSQRRFQQRFAAVERPVVTERLSSLDNALAAFAAAEVELELSMKDRDRPGQARTLQCWVSWRPRLVTTSSQPEFIRSLVEVRDDLRRQLDDAKARQDPACDHDRRHRDTGR